MKPAACATQGTPAGVGLDRLSELLLTHERVSDCNSQHRVTRKEGKRRKKPEIFPLGAEVFVDRTDNVTRYGTEHLSGFSSNSDW